MVAVRLLVAVHVRCEVCVLGKMGAIVTAAVEGSPDVAVIADGTQQRAKKICVRLRVDRGHPDVCKLEESVAKRAVGDLSAAPRVMAPVVRDRVGHIDCIAEKNAVHAHEERGVSVKVDRAAYADAPLVLKQRDAPVRR